MLNFFEKRCQQNSKQRRFGICDRDDLNPAYLDESNGSDWVAVVENEYVETVCFTAIDNCIELKNTDGTMKRRCDGALSYSKTVIFVELKDRKIKGAEWIKVGEQQLRSTITSFEKTDEAETFTIKKAYVANKAKPIYRDSQMARMAKFKNETGYTLRIENRIKIE